MRHTDEEVERAAKRFEQLADDLDPETAEVQITNHLRRIAALSEEVRIGEARVREPVELARSHGRLSTELAPGPVDLDGPGIDNLQVWVSRMTTASPAT